MLKFEYENLPINETCEIYSQTEDDKIVVCSRIGHDIPLYKWKDNYFRITETIPKSISDIKHSLYYGSINSTQAKQLLRFLNSFNKVATTNAKPYVVYDVIKEIWNGFYSAIQVGLINQD